VEDNFYHKLEKLNVQAGKKDKILMVHVQRICEAHDTVMRSYYQQIQMIYDILKIQDLKLPHEFKLLRATAIHTFVCSHILKTLSAFHISVPAHSGDSAPLRNFRMLAHSGDSGRLGLMRRRRWRTLEYKCMCK